MKRAQYLRAVEERDARYDGRFVYAVRSTGIYCRPSCPSRRPRPEQVVFFARPAEATAAGFRPCRRCQRPASDLVARICRYIERNQGERVTLAGLARETGKSPFHMLRCFKQATGITPRQYAEALRLGRLKSLLKKGSDVTTALYEAGYGSSSRLYEQADARLGMTPGVYRRGGEGMSIHYTLADCHLGRLLVASTGKGVCFVSLGAAGAPLEKALHDEYPGAEIQRDTGKMGRWVGEIAAYLRGKQTRLDLPLDLQATAFQTRVWEELRRIPYGETRSYSEVAQRLGKPKAVRAVARACATNPVSLVTPCHRVVREDGDLAGYRWGVDRKRALLNLEHARS